MGQCCKELEISGAEDDRRGGLPERLHECSAPHQPARQASSLTRARAARRDEIQSQACAARVQKIMEYASSDIRFDVPLADACFEDRQEFCANVPPGSARVIRCLQDRCCPSSYIMHMVEK